MSECKNCKLYEGDCGHHYADSYGHIHYDSSSLACTTRSGFCEYYQESRPERLVVKDELVKRYKDAHDDYYIGKAIRVIENLTNDEFDKLERGEAL